VLRALATTLLATAMTARAAALPEPLPPRHLVIIGLLGAWERADDPRRGVRKLALALRAQAEEGVYLETASNHDRRAVRRALVRALDTNGDHRLSAKEAARANLVLYGQSFGGAAAVKLSRDLARLGVPVRLTIQIDSIGTSDSVIPANVRRAANLYQRDPGPLRGQPLIRPADPARTKILENTRYSYLFKTVDLADYPWVARRLPIAHWKMDCDPEVWGHVRQLIEAEIAAWRAEPAPQ